jgi:O-antigen/teichoic acid export membrane protein
LITRYIGYIFQFINSIMIAMYLGPIYFGVWGFLQLIISYFNQINFGIHIAAGNLMAINKKKEKIVYMIFNTAFSIILFICIIVIILFSVNYFFKFPIGEQYQFYNYSLYVCGIVIFNYLNALFLNLFRIYNKLLIISLSQNLSPIFIFITILCSNIETILLNLLITSLCISLLILIIYFTSSPFKIKFSFNLSIVKKLIYKGYYLFICNSSFYLILISTQAFISLYFTVTNFGYFTFSQTFSSALTITLDSIAFLIYPKLLFKIKQLNNDSVIEFLNRFRKHYITIVSLFIYSGIAFFPFFLNFFPKYIECYLPFILNSLCLLIVSYGSGYSEYLVANGKEKQLAISSLISLFTNIFLCFLLINTLDILYYHVILATLFTFLIYNFLIFRFVSKKINIKLKFSISKIRELIPFLLSFLVIIKGNSLFLSFLPLSALIVLNFQRIKQTYSVSKFLIKDKLVLNF